MQAAHKPESVIDKSEINVNKTSGNAWNQSQLLLHVYLTC